jgi:hypothetical protein
VTGKNLVMDLTGESRDTQVQPPHGAWKTFFDVNLSKARARRVTYRMRNARRRGARYMPRPVVLHHHTATIEIPEVLDARPGIIRFWKMGKRKYEFFVYRPGTREHEHANWLLNTFPNPYRRHGRRWLVV